MLRIKSSAPEVAFYQLLQLQAQIPCEDERKIGINNEFPFKNLNVIILYYKWNVYMLLKFSRLLSDWPKWSIKKLSDGRYVEHAGFTENKNYLFHISLEHTASASHD